jgi:hypothetical protein
MKKVLTLAVVCALSVGGCASGSDKIAASYVSPLQYESYSCPQLAEEAQRVSARAATVAGVQDQKATNDAIATGVALVVFWPAAFLISGNDQTAAELGRLKGEFETIEKVAVKKNCGLQFQRTPTTTASITPGKT